MNTTENNKIIAEFIGWKEQEEDFMFNPKTSGSTYVKSLLFHKDWNWLMEVVEKIESIGGAVCIGNGNCVMIIFYLTDVMGESYSKTRELIGETKIQAVYNACVEFIKWYNENSAKNN